MKTNKFYQLAMAAMTLGLAACNSAEGDDPGAAPSVSPNVVNLVPAQATKVAFTSNDYDLSQGLPVTYENVVASFDKSDYRTVCGQVLQENVNNTELLKLDFLYYAKDADLEMELYPVSASTNQTHYLGVFYYDAEGQKHEVTVYENVNDDVWTSGGVKITIKKGYKFGFFWNAIDHDGNIVKYYSKKDLNPETKVYGGNWDADPVVHEAAGTFVLGGNTYLGIEDWIDFDFQDMAFVCTKELTIVDGDDILPTPDEPVVDPDPVDPDPVDPDPVDPDPVDPDEPVNPDPVDPADPEVVGGNGSVEINLALNAEHEQGDWIESHLSIHVRDTTDVTVFLPVSAEYYCPADDMMIVQKHDVAYQYNETEETVSMDINGNVVTLNVKFAENGITISTQGINADVLKYLRGMYGDGLTFEVRNYYNESVANRSVLQNMLNNSVVSFDTAPKIFVNAFGKTDDIVDPLACTVKPDEKFGYAGPTEKDSEHESALLQIYEK